LKHTTFRRNILDCVKKNGWFQINLSRCDDWFSTVNDSKSKWKKNILLPETNAVCYSLKHILGLTKSATTGIKKWFIGPLTHLLTLIVRNVGTWPKKVYNPAIWDKVELHTSAVDLSHAMYRLYCFSE